MADENTNSDVSCISDLEADDNDAIECFFGDLEEVSTLPEVVELE